MKKLFLFTMFAVAFVAFGAAAAQAGSPKVDVCHVPPGNPDNFHTIRISSNALEAHLAHGDLAGSCNALCAEICDDGDACTVDDTGDCEEQGCPVLHDPTNCDDGLSCTIDSCNSATGCVYEPVTCSASDLCHVSACDEMTGGCTETPVVCDAGFECNPATGSCDPDLPVLVVSGGNNVKTTVDNGTQLYIGSGRSAWSVYRNLPAELIGTVGSDTINTANVVFELSGEATCYLIRQNTWSAVSLAGWSPIYTADNYFTGYGTVDGQFPGATIYTKEFAAGSHSFVTFSAMYSCRAQ